MLDSVYILQDSVIVDTISLTADSIKSSEISTFFQKDKTDIFINSLQRNEMRDILTYVMVSLLAVLAIIWYLFPDRIISVFSISKTRRNYINDLQQLVPARVITVVFWIITLVSLTVLFYEATINFLYIDLNPNLQFHVLFRIFVLLIMLLLYRVIFEYVAAFIFNVKDILANQMEFAFKIHIISGIILLPVLLLSFYIYTSTLILCLLIMYGLVQLFRIVVFFMIGKSSSMFSALHIILYLCSLEIVPLLVLVRLIETGFLL